jgi:hypothetical protein
MASAVCGVKQVEVTFYDFQSHPPRTVNKDVQRGPGTYCTYRDSRLLSRSLALWSLIPFAPLISYPSTLARARLQLQCLLSLILGIDY